MERLRVKQLPLLSAVTQSDHIVEWQLPVELARRCGATDGQITFFDEQEQVVHGPSVGQFTTLPYSAVNAQRPQCW